MFKYFCFNYYTAVSPFVTDNLSWSCMCRYSTNLVELLRVQPKPMETVDMMNRTD